MLDVTADGRGMASLTTFLATPAAGAFARARKYTGYPVNTRGQVLGGMDANHILAAVTGKAAAISRKVVVATLHAQLLGFL